MAKVYIVNKSVIEKFFSNIENYTDWESCWLWKNRSYSYGYLGKKGLGIKAHRLSHLIFKGEVS